MQKFLIATLLMFLTLQASAREVGLLVYRVWEQGIDPYLTRVLVTPDYLRIDEGAGSNGFLLFDRAQEIVYNVSLDDQSVLVVDHTATVPGSNDALILQEVVSDDEAAPEIAGQRPRQVKLLANGEVCSEITAIAGVMPDAVEALAELKLAMARVQAATLGAIPLNMQTPCDLASHVYAPDRYLRFGLPVQERSEGRSQSLVDFSEAFEADDELFKVPEGFARRPMFIPGAI